jgi:hypothetical protein
MCAVRWRRFFLGDGVWTVRAVKVLPQCACLASGVGRGCGGGSVGKVVVMCVLKVLRGMLAVAIRSGLVENDAIPNLVYLVADSVCNLLVLSGER